MSLGVTFHALVTWLFLPLEQETRLPLSGLRKIDAAGPLAAKMSGDLGGDVINIEHPDRGEPAQMSKRESPLGD